MKKLLISGLLLCLFVGKYSAQQAVPVPAKMVAEFVVNEQQTFGFDSWQVPEWKEEYLLWNSASFPEYRIPYKSVGYDQSDLVDVQIRNTENPSADSLRFVRSEDGQMIAFSQQFRDRFTLLLPPAKKEYTVLAFYGEKEIGQLKVVVYKPVTEKVKIVPLTTDRIDLDSLRLTVNAIYRQANVQLDFELYPLFTHEELDSKELFDTPSPVHDRYTNQMRDLRDLYFDAHPEADRNAFYLFVISGFKDPSVRGYMVRSKAIAFVKAGNDVGFRKTVARQLARGIGLLRDSWQEKGPKLGSTDNLMDWSKGNRLRYRQWEDLRHSSHSYSFFDNYEDVRTNNGFVAYYFWEEDEHGTILVSGNDVLKAILRPYKKNYLSYHLNIDNVLFKPLFTVFDRAVCWLHIIAILVVCTLVFFLGRKWIAFIRKRFKRSWFWRVSWRFILIACAIYVSYLSFLLVNSGYSWFEVNEGKIAELKHLSIGKAIRKIGHNTNYRHPSRSGQCSELLILRKDGWHKTHRKQVLYFSVRKDDHGNWNRLRLQASSDSLLLPTLDFREKATSHYVVLNYEREDGSFERQRVINHLGMEITDKLNIADPPKRILLFVNGYRPTSIGHTFEENFRDIQNRGLEFPDSKNLVYTFDRYDYWRPWQAIDLQFQKRINPTETYYADGHFSVGTSNHRSLFNFTTTSSIYPKRCHNKKKHVCYRVKSVRAGNLGLKSVKTVSLHRTRPNRNGFRKRLENGRIAGRNIYQALNEIPNRSENDTLYIVAHSMGFAYALGIVEELRGKIHFGGFYIVAPENASAGLIRMDEWREIWQYGSNFNKDESDAPCLLDGVAPQFCVNGLSESNRIYIPKKYYYKKGFFDSHFIGYYRWIFDIPKGSPGHIPQR